MSRAQQQPYATTGRPAFAPLQSSSSSHATSYSSTSSLASQASIASATMPAPSSSPQPQQFYGSLNQQTQQPHEQQRMQAVRRHPSFDYQPNRSGSGQTAAETTTYLNQAVLLAEAAKRAQMACVMRDIGDMEL